MKEAIALVFIFLTFCIFCGESEAQAEIPMTPEVKQEYEVVAYIMGHISEWIEKQDWANWEPRRDGSRSAIIAKIIEKYEYPHDNYYVRIKSYLNAETSEREFWEIEVTIGFKSDKRFSMVETWYIYLIDLNQEEA